MTMMRASLDSYQQQQISQSDCKISSNCGKKKPKTYNMLLKDNIQCLHQDKVSKVIQES